MNNKRNAHCVVRFLKVTMNCPSLPLTAKTNLFLTLFTVRTESSRLTHIRWQPFTFVDVLFPNNKIILLAQTLFSAQPGFLFSSAIEKKKKTHTAVSCSKVCCSPRLLSPDPSYPCCESSQQEVLVPSD